MSRKKNDFPEFCYYEIPSDEDVLALLGAENIRNYGYNKKGEAAFRKHFHNLLEIGICRWGCGEIVIEGRKYHYEAGCVAVIPRNIPHMIINKKDEKSFWEYIYLNPSSFMETRGLNEKRDKNMYLDLIEGHWFFRNKGQVPLLVSEINLLMDQIRTQGYGYRQCVRGLAYTLLMEIAKINYTNENQFKAAIQPRTDKTQKIAKALDYIDEHYWEKIKVSDIAEAAFISTTYLRKLFMDYCMMPPMQYVNYVRINAACKLMRKTDDNINEVARKVGYENLTTFINNFKIYTGETPKQWKDKQVDSQ